MRMTRCEDCHKFDCNYGNPMYDGREVIEVACGCQCHFHGGKKNKGGY